MYKEIWDSGSCTQTDPEVFFPELGRNDLTKAAKKICSECVVLDLCLEKTLENPHQYGIQAGLTVADLRKLKRGA